MNYGDLKSIVCDAFKNIHDDETLVLIEIDGIVFDVDCLVNGSSAPYHLSHPILVCGKTESGRTGHHTHFSNAHLSEKGTRLFKHVQSILYRKNGGE